MKFQQRSSVYTNLRQYCYHAKPDDIVEVAEWLNGEGWDISFGNRIISITMGELQAINVLCNVAHPKD
jgi:hypothetical protein